MHRGNKDSLVYQPTVGQCLMFEATGTADGWSLVKNVGSLVVTSLKGLNAVSFKAKQIDIWMID